MKLKCIRSKLPHLISLLSSQNDGSVAWIRRNVVVVHRCFTHSITEFKDDIIARQMTRAIEYWNESKLKHNEPLKDAVHHQVMKYLEEGKVLPIFHTLCQPPNQRLFAPNTRISVKDPNSDVIQLSAATVTPGECIKDANNDGEIALEEEMSFIPAFFNQHGAGHFYVKDMAVQWSFSSLYTQIVTDLVNAPAEMVGEDIEVTKLLQPLAVDDCSGCNLITRRLSRGVVSDCLAKSQRRSTYAIVGNPGIGKSWTLIYALQQALLYENVCILLCFQKDGMAITCIRRNNKIYVWRSNNGGWKSSFDSNLFRNSNILALLDPLESAKGGAAYTEGPRMMMIAASNNEKHVSTIGKFTGDYARILNCYSNVEMTISLPFMIEDSAPLLQMDQVMKRAMEVGNLPRYVLKESLFKERQRQTVNAIESLKRKEVKDIMTFDGINRSNNTVPGCIFEVSVNLHTISGMNEASDDDQSYEYKTNDIHYMEKVGYDGQLVPDYGNRVVSIISKHVLNGIVNLSRDYVLSFWGITSTGKRSEMGSNVEDLLWKDLQKPYRMRKFLMMKQADKKLNANSEQMYLDVGKCHYIDKVSFNQVSLGKEVFDAVSVVAKMKKNEALIDFAGPGHQVYQVTVSPSHSLSINGLRELFLVTGHLENKGGILQISKNAAKIGQISYYWVVPEGQESHWKSKVPRTIKKDPVLSKCLNNFVNQYVLVMDTEPIESKT
jgi:hypothetical protein